MRRTPPMFTSPSFLALMVAPSARSNMAREMGPGSVEVVVCRDPLAGPGHGSKPDGPPGPPLMRGQNVRHAGQPAQPRLKAIPASRTGIGLVAAQHARPLLGRHRRRAAVGE